MSDVTLLEYVLELGDDDLAAMWCSFNRWAWPEVLPDAHRPYWWDGHPAASDREIANRKSGFVKPFMDYADAKLGEDALLDKWQEVTA